MVIKAQVLTGGRGKGHFANGLKGGVKLISSPVEAKLYAQQMLNQTLITKQTGPAGKKVTAVYIVERKFVRREAYISILMDRQSQCPMIVVSAQGGMDIEGVAKDTPEAIKTFKIDINKGVTDELATSVAKELGFSETATPEAIQTIKNLYSLFDKQDATQVEINPLSETIDHKVLAMDAKLGFDDNASFRQQKVWRFRDLAQEDPEEVEAAKYGLNFIKLDGTIGCLVNGAGLAMSTMDIIKLNGGEPANFLDCGGGATPQTIEKGFRLITADKKVTAIFVNIFGGIVRCDDIAKGLVAVTKNMKLKIPLVVRLQGTNMEPAKKLIADSGLKIFAFTDLDQAAQKVCQLAQVVKLARKIDATVTFELPL